MRKGSAFTLAVVGVVSCAALFALNSLPPSNTALFSPITAEDHMFVQFVTKYSKSYETKEEYMLRS